MPFYAHCQQPVREYQEWKAGIESWLDECRSASADPAGLHLEQKSSSRGINTYTPASRSRREAPLPPLPPLSPLSSVKMKNIQEFGGHYDYRGPEGEIERSMKGLSLRESPLRSFSSLSPSDSVTAIEHSRTRRRGRSHQRPSPPTPLSTKFPARAPRAVSPRDPGATKNTAPNEGRPRGEPDPGDFSFEAVFSAKDVEYLGVKSVDGVRVQFWVRPEGLKRGTLVRVRLVQSSPILHTDGDI